MEGNTFDEELKNREHNLIAAVQEMDNSGEMSCLRGIEP